MKVSNFLFTSFQLIYFGLEVRTTKVLIVLLIIGPLTRMSARVLYLLHTCLLWSQLVINNLVILKGLDVEFVVFVLPFLVF